MMYLKYFWLQIKKSYKHFAGVLAGAIIFTGLIGILMWCASQSLYSGGTVSVVTVGINMDADDTLGNIALTMLGSLKSVQQLCRIEIFETKEEGLSALEDGNISALIYLPEDYYNQIISGADTPVTIYVNENEADMISLFMILTDAGSLVMESAQISFQVNNAYCESLGTVTKEQQNRVEAAIDTKNLWNFMTRLTLFDSSGVSATGRLSLVQYYLNAGIVLILFFLGIPAASLFLPEESALEEKLAAAGMGRFKQAAAEAASRFLMLLSLLILVYVGSLVGLRLTGKSLPVLTPAGVLGILLSVLCVVLMLSAVYRWFRHSVTGAMAVFLLTAGMGWCCGCFVPTAFLPTAIAKLGSVLPMRSVMNGMAGLFGMSPGANDCLSLAAFCLIFYLLAAAGRRRTA